MQSCDTVFQTTEDGVLLLLLHHCRISHRKYTIQHRETVSFCFLSFLSEYSISSEFKTMVVVERLLLWLKDWLCSIVLNSLYFTSKDPDLLLICRRLVMGNISSGF